MCSQNSVPPSSPRLVPCLTPGCSGPQIKVAVGIARAHVESFRRFDPTFQITLVCDLCQRTNRYSLEALTEMIPISQRPKELADDEAIVVLLLPLDTSDEMELYAFAGERVRVTGYTARRNGWGLGELLTPAAIAPTLQIGDILSYDAWGPFLVATGVLIGGERNDLELQFGARSNALGTFFAPKQNLEKLTTANLFCANPSCCGVLRSTYTDFRATCAGSAKDLQRVGAASAHVFMECSLCGTARLVDEASFVDLVKV